MFWDIIYNVLFLRLQHFTGHKEKQNLSAGHGVTPGRILNSTWQINQLHWEFTILIVKVNHKGTSKLSLNNRYSEIFLLTILDSKRIVYFQLFPKPSSRMAHEGCHFCVLLCKGKQSNPSMQCSQTLLTRKMLSDAKVLLAFLLRDQCDHDL